MDGWVVKYLLRETAPSGKSYGLAVVKQDGSALQPLCTWEEGQLMFVEDEQVDALDVEGRVYEVVDDIFIGNRQLPRLHNPHGEMSELTYLILEGSDIDDVAVVIRPDREPGDI